MASLGSTVNVDFKFFDLLAEYRFPDLDPEIIQHYRTAVEFGDIDISTMLENAMANCANYKRDSTIGRDFDDASLSDSKRATAFEHGSRKTVNGVKKNTTYDATISSLHAKVGAIRACVYEPLHDKFYFFVIPHDAYKGLKNIYIPFGTRYSDSYGYPMRNNKWWKYEVPSFYELANRFSIKNAEDDQ